MIEKVKCDLYTSKRINDLDCIILKYDLYYSNNNEWFKLYWSMTLKCKRKNDLDYVLEWW